MGLGRWGVGGAAVDQNVLPGCEKLVLGSSSLPSTLLPLAFWLDPVLHSYYLDFKILRAEDIRAHDAGTPCFLIDTDLQ